MCTSRPTGRRSGMQSARSTGACTAPGGNHRGAIHRRRGYWTRTPGTVAALQSWKPAATRPETRAGRTSEKPLRHDDRVTGLHDVGQLDLELLLFAVDYANDTDPAGRAAIGDPAGQRQRLQHARVPLLQGVGARTFYLTEYVDTLSSRDENRVAIAQRSILGEHPVLQIPKVHALDVRRRVLRR